MAVESVPHSEKQSAFEALRRMPETATLEEMSEELAILAALRQAEAAAATGQLIAHEEVVRRSATWTSK